MLNEKGFYVHSVQEAYYCIDNALDRLRLFEVKEYMEDSQCRDCQSSSGSKSTGPPS